MIEGLRKLIESLRDELKNYGEMLALLDRQQEFLRTRAATEMSQSMSLVQSQGLVIQESRLWREKCRSVVAREIGHSEEVTFAELIPRVPSEYQPLLMALVEENNHLLAQVRKRARQNHMMLKRSVELMAQVMNSLNPAQREAADDSETDLPPRYSVLPGEAPEKDISEIPVQSHAQN